MTSFAPLTATIGAEVTGVDLVADLTQAGVTTIRSALLDRKMLVFRDQRLDLTSHRAFAAALGELTPAHPVVPGLDADHPEIYVLDSSDGGKAPIWHTAHYAVDDYGDQHRVMHRITVRGDEPVGPRSLIG